MACKRSRVRAPLAPLMRFVIATVRRTGSTMLSRALDNLPGVKCWGEIVNDQDSQAQASEKLTAYWKTSTEFPVVGCKWLWGQPGGPSLGSDPGIRVVRLERWNLLAGVVSECILEATVSGQHPMLEKTDDSWTVTASPEQIQSAMRDREEDMLNVKLWGRATQRTMMSVSYEGILKGVGDWPRLLKFLGINDNLPFMPETRKIETRPATTVFKDFDGVERMLRDQNKLWMLEEWNLGV